MMKDEFGHLLIIFISIISGLCMIMDQEVNPQLSRQNHGVVAGDVNNNIQQQDEFDSDEDDDDYEIVLEVSDDDNE